VLPEDTEDMNRGRAETHLRQLTEAELRCATVPGALGRGHASRLPLVAQALIAAGAVDAGRCDNPASSPPISFDSQRLTTH
jgi:hypothetical protein